MRYAETVDTDFSCSLLTVRLLSRLKKGSMLTIFRSNGSQTMETMPTALPAPLHVTNRLTSPKACYVVSPKRSMVSLEKPCIYKVK